MSEKEKIITETEAKIITQRFLLLKYPQAKIQIFNVQLLTEEGSPVYLVQGKLIRKSRSLLDRFLSPIPTNQYSFRVKLHAIQKRVLHYEFH